MSEERLSKATITSSKHALYGKICTLCEQPARAGQDVMVFDSGKGIFIGRDVVWHRNCVKEFVDRRWPKSNDREAKKLDAAIRRVRRGGSRVMALLSD